MKYILISIFFLSLASCSDSKETTITTADGKDMTIKQSGDGENATITTKGENGETATITTGSDAKGSTLPGGVVAYPGSTSTMNITGNQGGKSGGMAVMESPDDPARIIAFYKADAAKRGLTKDVSETNSNTDGQNSAMFSAKSGDGVGIMVTAAQSDGKTTFTVMGGKE